MFILGCSNTIHSSIFGGSLRLNNKSLPDAPLFSNESKLLTFQEMVNIELVEGDPGLEQTAQTVNSYYHQLTTKSLRRDIPRSKFLFTTIPTILKALVHILKNKRTILNNLQQHYYPQWVALSRSLVDKMSSKSVFYDVSIFLMNLSPQVSGLANTQNIRMWDTKNRKKIREH